MRRYFYLLFAACLLMAAAPMAQAVVLLTDCATITYTGGVWTATYPNSTTVTTTGESFNGTLIANFALSNAVSTSSATCFHVQADNVRITDSGGYNVTSTATYPEVVLLDGIGGSRIEGLKILVPNADPAFANYLRAQGGHNNYIAYLYCGSSTSSRFPTVELVDETDSIVANSTIYGGISEAAFTGSSAGNTILDNLVLSAGTSSLHATIGIRVSSSTTDAVGQGSVIRNTVVCALSGTDESNYTTAPSAVNDVCDDAILLTDDTNITIDSNNLYWWSDAGVELYHDVSNVTISNNAVYGYTWAGAAQCQYGIGGWYYLNLSYVTISHNTIDKTQIGFGFYRTGGLISGQSTANQNPVAILDNTTTNLFNGRAVYMGSLYNVTGIPQWNGVTGGGTTTPTSGSAYFIFGGNTFTGADFYFGDGVNYFTSGLVGDSGGNYCSYGSYDYHTSGTITCH